jgi:Sulfite exporter TauE/SafE
MLEWLLKWKSSPKDVIRPQFATFAIMSSGLLILSVLFIELSYSESSIIPHRILKTVGHHMKHKDIFPLDQSDVIGTVLVGLGLMIAASGGVGGGGILVPLLIIVYGFHPKNAIPLSNFTILGSSITNMILNFPKRHPDADRPLVDWDLILIMEPVTMAGAVSCC